MDDLLSLFRSIRKVEVLFLSFLPARWRNPPPSYRIILPILKRLSRHEEQFPWAAALLYSIQNDEQIGPSMTESA
jgi:hypothetical protein